MNLRLLQISDSALPVGGYTHSWGLEAALARRIVHDAATLERWTRDWLRYALAPLEGVIAAAACRAGIAADWSAVRRSDEILGASIAPPSIRGASAEMGTQLLALAATWTWSAARIGAFRSLWSGRRWHHAVAFGLLGGLAGAGPVLTLTAYLHQAALAMISAGVRAVPVNPTHGQQILAYLHEDIEETAERFAAAEPEEAGAGYPFYEVLCDEQTRLYTRLFRS